MTVNEQNVGGYAQSNVPFVLAVYLIDRQDVLSVLDPVRCPQPGGSLVRIPAGGIVVKTGAVVTRMKFPPLACSFSQTLSRTDGGVTSSVGINFSIPASREDVSAWYSKSQEKQFVALFEDTNRQAYLVGNEERGVRVSLAQSIASVNEHSVTLSGTFNLPAFLLPSLTGGIVLADLFPGTDFSIDFSLDFNA